MERGFVGGQRGAGPGMTAQVEGVLVTLGFVLVLESVRAILAYILFFHFMCAIVSVVSICRID